MYRESAASTPLGELLKTYAAGMNVVVTPYEPRIASYGSAAHVNAKRGLNAWVLYVAVRVALRHHARRRSVTSGRFGMSYVSLVVAERRLDRQLPERLLRADVRARENE